MPNGVTQPAAVSPEDYNTFVQQVELVAVWLEESHTVNHFGGSAPERAEVEVDRDPRWEAVVQGFQAFDRYRVTIKAEGKKAATLDVTFGLHYLSEQRMTDALFQPFGGINLPLNSWPFAREFVFSHTGRMNWVPLTLPALKRSAQRPAARRPAARRSRAARPSAEPTES